MRIIQSHKIYPLISASFITLIQSATNEDLPLDQVSHQSFDQVLNVLYLRTLHKDDIYYVPLILNLKIKQINTYAHLPAYAH